MNKYELMYIISKDATEEQREAVIEKFKAFVEGNGGVVTGLDRLGMKKFAYAIDFKNEGYYVLMNFEAEGSLVKEMNNAMNIADFVVRQIFIRK